MTLSPLSDLVLALTAEDLIAASLEPALKLLRLVIKRFLRGFFCPLFRCSVKPGLPRAVPIAGYSTSCQPFQIFNPVSSDIAVRKCSEKASLLKGRESR